MSYANSHAGKRTRKIDILPAREDLKTANPKGRVDVLTYQTAQYLTKHMEQKHGLSGIWDALEPHAQSLIHELLGGFQLPPEAKVLMGIVQANWDKLNQPIVEAEESRLP